LNPWNANSGRWIQSDPAGLAASDPSNPQTWNRYAYVGNNPLIATDPLGLLSGWSDVVGTGRGSGVDPLPDPGGAWLSAQTQQFMADAGLLSPMQTFTARRACEKGGSGWQIWADNSHTEEINGNLVYFGGGTWIGAGGGSSGDVPVGMDLP
jgi:uncharacterized protein RhaS with RHS repeats